MSAAGTAEITGMVVQAMRFSAYWRRPGLASGTLGALDRPVGSANIPGMPHDPLSRY